MSLQVPTPTGRKTRRSRPRRMSAMGGSSRIAYALYNELRLLIAPMIAEIGALGEWLLSNPGAAVAFAALTAQQEKWREQLKPGIRSIAAKWVKATDERDKKSLEKGLAQSLGVDFTAIFDDKPVRDTVELMAVEAINLISTVPEEYYSKVKQAVMLHYQQKELPEGRTLLQELKNIDKLTAERAKLIAVDQTNKMHSMVTQTRQTSLGIEEYIWRTAKDSRVVGTPGGLYPEGNRMHGNHYAREGKVFRWDEPPADGHPGYPIRCRCWAQPIIDYDKLNLS